MQRTMLPVAADDAYFALQFPEAGDRTGLRKLRQYHSAELRGRVGKLLPKRGKRCATVSQDRGDAAGDGAHEKDLPKGEAPSKREPAGKKEEKNR